MTALHLVRLALERRKLLRLARLRKRAAEDAGYVIHAGLAAAFAEVPERRAAVPLHNFVEDEAYAAARGDSEGLYLLAYSDIDEAGLRRRMTPAGESIIRTCATREVPTIPSGTKVAYRVRACPVMRTRLAPQGDARGGGKSRELDAWLVRRIRAGWTHVPPGGPGTSFERQSAEWREREEVYGGWLAEQLGRAGAGALLEPSRMVRFQRARLYRRKADSGRLIERPDVVLEGRLEVADAKAFREVLRRGIGRHRAFGFGSLLVRPA